MGKRKKSSRKPVSKKKTEPLSTTFQCLFCNHEKSVTVKMLKKEGVGQLSCRVCGQSYQTGINYLSAAVDVYSDWIDACEAVANKDTADAAGNTAATSYREIDVSSRAQRPAASGARVGEDDLGGFIDQDEGDMEGGYDDED